MNRLVKPVPRLVLLFWMLSIGQAQSYETKEQVAPWLRIYSGYVHDLYFDLSDAQIAQGVEAKNVLVAVSQKNIFPAKYDPPLTRLINYATNRIENDSGCIVHPSDDSPATDTCGHLRLKALRKFSAENQTCKAAESPHIWTWIFIDKKLRYVRCIGKSIGSGFAADRYLHDERTNEWRRLNIDLRPRHLLRSGTPPELVMGQNAYLGLEGNRLFGCFSYGVPVTFREKNVQQAEAVKNQPEPDDSLYRLPPTWQYQYLVKTRGFIYYCEQGKRLIDEPEGYGITLADGTALLRGNVTVLRIRTMDGSTDAPIDRVKRVDPALTRQRLADAIGPEKLNKNSDICNPSISSECPLATNGFIPGIDHVMQSFFPKH